MFSSSSNIIPFTGDLLTTSLSKSQTSSGVIWEWRSISVDSSGVCEGNMVAEVRWFNCIDQADKIAHIDDVEPLGAAKGEIETMRN
jgi:hypothetical protein